MVSIPELLTRARAGVRMLLKAEAAASRRTVEATVDAGVTK